MLTNLKTIRIARGLTQDNLSSLTGISQTALSRLERGERNPRPATVRLLALVLGCDRRDLTRGPVDADQPAA
jgi:transcriptional regulator with XRE-family HTH domain